MWGLIRIDYKEQIKTLYMYSTIQYLSHWKMGFILVTGLYRLYKTHFAYKTICLAVHTDLPLSPELPVKPPEYHRVGSMDRSC